MAAAQRFRPAHQAHLVCAAPLPAWNGVGRHLPGCTRQPAHVEAVLADRLRLRQQADAQDGVIGQRVQRQVERRPGRVGVAGVEQRLQIDQDGLLPDSDDVCLLYTSRCV